MSDESIDIIWMNLIIESEIGQRTCKITKLISYISMQGQDFMTSLQYLFYISRAIVDIINQAVYQIEKKIPVSCV